MPRASKSDAAGKSQNQGDDKPRGRGRDRGGKKRARIVGRGRFIFKNRKEE